MTNYQDVRTTQHEQGREQRIFTFKATQIIWLLLGLLEAVIALRVVFKLIGVNATNPFAMLLYNVTNLFVAPFATLTNPIASGNMVLEVSSIIAMVIYLLIAWAFERIVYVLFYRTRGPVTVTQTAVSEHIPQQAPLGSSQSMSTTDRIPPQVHLGSSQRTSTTERSQVQTPRQL